MKFDNSFEVPVPIEEAWPVLMDIERIAPCVPGAELTNVLDERTYEGKIAVKLGPVALSFNGQAKFEELDNDARTARIKAQGTDSNGGAQAEVGFSMEPSENGARVLIHTNLQLSGAVAQYGRGVGMVADLAQHIIGQFADNLAKNVLSKQAGDSGGGGGNQAQAAPVEVGSLGIKVLWNAIVRGIKSLFGGGS